MSTHTQDEEAYLLGLAKLAITTRLEGLTGEIPDCPERLQVTGSCFVTLRIKGELRGCMGDLRFDRPLAEAIWKNARSAAFEDPRFAPVRADEWPSITMDITILAPPESVDSADEIMIGRHGIILTKHGKRAVFLPQVATDQGWDLATTLNHLARKAGLPADAWKRGCDLQVFEGTMIED